MIQVAIFLFLSLILRSVSTLRRKKKRHFLCDFRFCLLISLQLVPNLKLVFSFQCIWHFSIYSKILRKVAETKIILLRRRLFSFLVFCVLLFIWMQTNFHENDFALCIFRIGGGEIACSLYSLRQFMISKVISPKEK